MASRLRWTPKVGQKLAVGIITVFLVSMLIGYVAFRIWYRHNEQQREYEEKKPVSMLVIRTANPSCDTFSHQS